MEFPFGHRHHHHNQDDEPNRHPPSGFEQQPPPPQSGYGGYPPSAYPPPPQHGYQQPLPPDQYYGGGGGPTSYGPPSDYAPPPSVHHVSHQVDPDPYGYAPPPPPQTASAHHVSHEVGHTHSYGHGHHGGGSGEYQQSYNSSSMGGPGGYSSSHVPHVGHEGGGGFSPSLPSVRILTKAKEDYSLSIRNGTVVLVPHNPRDDYQHWIKDLKYSTKVKDEEGFPSFALVNKVTGEAIKHSVGATHPVRLVKYNPDYLDESVLWTESKDLGDGFRCIRMVNNIRLNFDAFHGDEDHGGVHDGTNVVLWEWAKGKNQRWKIVPS